MTVVLLGPLVAQAQDALRSVLSVEQTLQGQQYLPYMAPPEQPHIGPVQLTLGLYASAQFNDNINTAQIGGQSDTIVRGGTRLGLVWPATEHSELRLNAGVGYVHYLDHSQYDSLELAPDSTLAWNVSFVDGSVTLFDQFTYSRQVLSQAALSGLAIFPHFENSVGARADWLPNQWAFSTGYTHDDYFSDLAQFQYLDRSSEYFFGRAGWRFGEKSQAGLEASAGLTSYRLTIQSDNTSISLGPYLEWQARQNFRLELRGGPTIYSFNSRQSATQTAQLDAYYLGLVASDQLTDSLSQRLELRRDIQLGFNQGSDYLKQLSANYWLSWALTRRVTFSAHLTYENGTQPFEVPIYLPFEVLLLRFKEDFERLGTGPEISWQFTHKFVAKLSYSYWRRTSSLPGRGYEDNDVLFRLEYTF